MSAERNGATPTPELVPYAANSVGSPADNESRAFARSNAFSSEPGGSSPAFAGFFV